MALITLVLGALLLFQLLYVIPCIENRGVEMAPPHQREIARSIARELGIDQMRGEEGLTSIAGLVELRNSLADYRLEEGQVAFVGDRQGTVVAHSRTDLFAPEEDPLSLDLTNRPLVQAIMSGEMGKSLVYDHDGTLSRIAVVAKMVRIGM